LIFAVGIENTFVELFGLSEGLGKKLKKLNPWLWAINLAACGLFFFHTLLNPHYDFLQALQHGNTQLFIAVAISFIGFTFLMWFLASKRRQKKH